MAHDKTRDKVTVQGQALASIVNAPTFCVYNRLSALWQIPTEAFDIAALADVLANRLKPAPEFSVSLLPKNCVPLGPLPVPGPGHRRLISDSLGSVSDSL